MKTEETKISIEEQNEALLQAYVRDIPRITNQLKHLK